MKILIVAASALVVGIALGIVFSAATIRHLRQRNRELRAIIREEAGPVKPETMKRVVWACVGNGFAWVKRPVGRASNTGQTRSTTEKRLGTGKWTA